MVSFPNCKINLGLRILEKRGDGYHNLETVFYPIGLKDVLEIIPYTIYQTNNGIPFHKSGFDFDDDPSDNLCIKAYKILKKDYPQMPNVQMHLHKGIPSGAGLGGGSSDGAYTLVMLNELFSLGISQEKLREYALQLGSDCPFFLLNKPCYAIGRGELMQPVELNLKGLKIYLVNPGIHINTGRAFLNSKPSFPDQSILEILKKPVRRWKDELVNDFENWVFNEHREVVEIKDKLYIAGALFASMSGSGSTVYGLFDPSHQFQFDFPPHYFVKELICEF